jgi:hypothetical protein
VDIDQVTRMMAGTGRRQALAGLLTGATALGTHHLAAAKQRKKKRKKKCKKSPTRDTCPQQACCSCNAGGGEPELCGTIEPGANQDENVERCIAFCQDIGGTVFTLGPAPDTVQLCDSGNFCRRVPCPLL